MLRIVMSLSRLAVAAYRSLPAALGKGHARERLATDKFFIIQSLDVKFTKNKNIGNCQAAARCDRPVCAICP
tara:strand:- start:671 stop:886 length:216 start_codon:yes stop_codon:yes gene_type:complete